MTIKTTIETINGKLCTIVWYDTDIQLKTCERVPLDCGGFVFSYSAQRNNGYHVATALPALPKHPKPEDSRLIHRYLAEGIRPLAIAQTPKGLPLGIWCGMGVLEACEDSRNMKIIRGFDDADEEVEVAIDG